MLDAISHECREEFICEYCDRRFKSNQAVESHKYALEGTKGHPLYVDPATLVPQSGGPPVVTTRLLGSSQEFKEALLEELRVARSDVKVRIQAYHFDCEDIVQALDRSSVQVLNVLVDERAAREAPRTISAIAKLKEAGADVRFISGRDMFLCTVRGRAFSAFTTRRQYSWWAIAIGSYGWALPTSRPLRNTTMRS
jgi:hypothetical protein